MTVREGKIIVAVSGLVSGVLVGLVVTPGRLSGPVVCGAAGAILGAVLTIERPPAGD